VRIFSVYTRDNLIEYVRNALFCRGAARIMCGIKLHFNIWVCGMLIADAYISKCQCGLFCGDFVTRRMR
jgi:hypothetical protein